MRSYQLVKEKDLAGLQEYLIDHCIDEWLPGSYFYSSTSKFAEEGDFHHVEIMLNQGAFINYAAVGAGCGNHQAYADHLIVRGANINYVARGAAWRGHIEYVEQLIARGANKDFVAFGFGLGGCTQGFITCLTDLEHYEIEHYESYNRGLLLSGRKDLINQVVETEKQNPKFRGAWFWLGVGLAFHEDNKNLVNEVTKELPLMFATDHFAYGAALGGHYKYLEACVSGDEVRIGRIDRVIFAAALSGRTEIIRKLFKNGKFTGNWHGLATHLFVLVRNLRSIINGSFAGGHLMYLSQFDASKRRSRQLALDIQPAIFEGHVRKDNPRSVMLYLSPFPPKMIPTLAAGLLSNEEFNDASFGAHYLKHLCDISRARQIGMPFELARLATEKNEHGQFVNQAALMIAISAFVAGSAQSSYMGLFKDIWKIILNDVFDLNFSRSEWEAMTLLLTKTLMTTVLADYTRLFNHSRNKPRAKSFAAAVKDAKSTTELRALVSEQKQLVIDGKREPTGNAKHERPLRFKKPDQYHHIISLWVKRLTPSTQQNIEVIAQDNNVRELEPEIRTTSTIRDTLRRWLP